MRIKSSAIWPEIYVYVISTFTCVSFLGFAFGLPYSMVDFGVFLHAYLA